MGAHWENKTRDFRSLAFSVTLHVEKCRKYRYMFYHLTEQMGMDDSGKLRNGPQFALICSLLK